MRKPTSILLLTTTAIITMLLAVTTAQAISDPLEDISVNVLKGINGKVDVGEFEFNGLTEIGEEGVEASGGYFVDVLNEEYSVFGFAVSINSHVYPYTDRLGWNAAFISAEEWNAGHAIGLEEVPSLLTTDIAGDFSSLFGDDEYVNLYYNDFGSDIVDNTSTDPNVIDTDQPFPTNPELAQFFFGEGFVASEFVAFTNQGNIIDQSLQTTQPIPEPSTIFLFGTGIVGLIAHTLRKKHGVVA